MNAPSSRRPDDRSTSTLTARAPYMPTSIDVFAKVRGHEREELLRAAREADLLPYFRTVESPAMPVVEMEGAARIMLGVQQLPRADRRRARDPGRRGRAAPLRHRPHRVAPAQRHDAAAPRARERDRRLDGHRGRDRLHHRPPGQRRHARHAARRRATPSSWTPATTPRSSTAALLSRAKLRPFRHNRMDKLERTLERAPGGRRRRAGRRRRGLLDGGRRRAAARDRRALRALRRAPDGRRGARRGRARRARRGRLRSCSASRTASTCGWARSRSRWPPAAASWPARPRSSSTCASLARLPVHRLGRARGARRRARRAAGAALARRGRALLAAVLDNARHLRDGPARRSASVVVRRASRSAVQAPRRRAGSGAAIVTPIVPVLVGDDWKAALLWRALYDAGVFTNCALHPAVPPGGALLRTSVMATHDARHARPGARGLRARQARLRGRARPAARRPSRRERAAAPRACPALGGAVLSKSSQVPAQEKGRF